MELTQRIPEKSDEVVPVFVRRVKRRPEVFAIVVSISSLAFGAEVQIPTLPFAKILIRSEYVCVFTLPLVPVEILKLIPDSAPAALMYPIPPS